MNVIEILDIKNFMVQLLLQEMFDTFLLYEARVMTASEMILRGARHREWYDSDDLQAFAQAHSAREAQYMTWGERREIIFSYIKGKRPPQSLDVDLEASEIQAAQMMPGWQRDAEASVHFRLQMHYREGKLTLVPIVTQEAFSVDAVRKQMRGEQWTQAVCTLLRQKKIVFCLRN